MVDYSKAPGIPGAEDQLSKWRCRQSSKGDRLIRGDAHERFRLKIGKKYRMVLYGKKVPFSAVLTAGSAKKCRFYHVSGLL